MVLKLPISREAEAKLVARAAAAGVDLTTFATQMLERAAVRPTLDEVLAPLRLEVSQSGMSEAELTEQLEQAKHEARAEQHARQVS